MEKSYIGFIIGGAIIGALAGYLVRRIGVPKIMDTLKEHDVIPERVVSIIDEFKHSIES